jgi:cholesterol transport system auxiliary component
MAHRNNGVEGKAARAAFFVVVLAVFGLAVLGLAACAQPPRQTFDLAGVAALARASIGSGAALSVREPTAAAPTSTDRIVVRDRDGSVSVLPDVQWSERLPRLLQTRMVEALRNAGVSAARFGSGGRALTTAIGRFEIDVARDLAVVEISARIVDERSGAALSARSFTAQVPAPEHTGAAAALALTQAAAQAMTRLSAWARSGS